jgi:excinuclease UvrABC nuclease subunit
MNQALYRWFDQTGTLLYVGVSGSLHKRVKQHEKSAEWFTEASFMTVEWFASRAEVERAERRAISQEKPLHNKVFADFGGTPAQITPPDKYDRLNSLKRRLDFYRIQYERQQVLDSRYQGDADFYRQLLDRKQTERIFVA